MDLRDRVVAVRDHPTRQTATTPTVPANQSPQSTINSIAAARRLYTKSHEEVMRNLVQIDADIESNMKMLDEALIVMIELDKRRATLEKTKDRLRQLGNTLERGLDDLQAGKSRRVTWLEPVTPAEAGRLYSNRTDEQLGGGRQT